MSSEKRRVAIVGGGISGLSCAYFLLRAGNSVEIFDQGASLGGLLGTKSHPLGLVETAANAFLNSSLLEEISREIQVPLVSASRESRKRYLYVGQRATRWPLSLGQSLRMFWGVLFMRFRPPHPGESIRDWGARVLGAAASDRLLTIALQGVYAGEGARLSASLILSRFFRKSPGPKVRVRRGSVSPKHGMGEWIRGLQNCLEARGVRVHCNSKISSESLTAWSASYDAVVIATRADGALDLVKTLVPDWAQRWSQTLEMIPLTSATGFFEPSAQQLRGFGVLFARGEGVLPLGVLFNSDIFPGRSSLRSETWIVPGVDRSAEELKGIIAETQKRLYGDSLVLKDLVVTKWDKALPYYSLEWERILGDSSGIEKLKKHRVFLVGNYLGNIGLSQLIERAQKTAEEIQNL